MVEQGTHKPLVGSSNLPLATDVNHDQQLREFREVVDHFSVCDKGLREGYVTNIPNNEDLARVWQGTSNNEVLPQRISARSRPGLSAVALRQACAGALHARSS